MQAMYEKIAQELKSMDLVDSRLQDYLNFYCIGNREEIPQELSSADCGMVSVSEYILKWFLILTIALPIYFLYIKYFVGCYVTYIMDIAASALADIFQPW